MSRKYLPRLVWPLITLKNNSDRDFTNVHPEESFFDKKKNLE